MECLTNQRNDLQIQTRDMAQELHLAKDRADQLAKRENDLKSQLQEKSEEARRRSEERNTFNIENINLKTKLTMLEASQNQLHTQVTKQRETIDTLRRRMEIQAADSQKSIDTTEVSKNEEMSRMTKEMNEVFKAMEQARYAEAEVGKICSGLKVERNSLLEKVSSLQATVDAQIARLKDQASSANEQIVELDKAHAAIIADRDLKLVNKDAVLKQSEARIRLLEDEHEAKIEADRKVAESKLLELEKHYKAKLETAAAQAWFPKQEASQLSIVRETPPPTSQDILSRSHVGQQRRKIVRQNASVLVLNDTGRQQAMVSQNTAEADPDHRPQVEDGDTEKNLFDEDADIRELFPNFDSGDIVQAEGSTYETQDLSRGPYLQMDVSNDVASTSTELTEVDSDALTQLETDVRMQSLKRNDGHDDSLSKRKQGHAGKMACPSLSPSRLSQPQDRPRSRANTASRMMPPPAIHNDIEQCQPSDRTASRMGSGSATMVHLALTEHDSSSSSRCIQALPAAKKTKHSCAESLVQNGISQRKRDSSSSSSEQETPSKKARVSSTPRLKLFSPSHHDDSASAAAGPSTVNTHRKDRQGHAQISTVNRTPRSARQALDGSAWELRSSVPSGGIRGDHGRSLSSAHSQVPASTPASSGRSLRSKGESILV